MVATYQLLSRLVIERTKHHLPDDADTLAQQAAVVEDELASLYPARWSRLRTGLLQEEAAAWAETHDEDLLNCRSCRLQNGILAERIDVRRPRRTSA